ncbi:hypothetical protein LB507_009995 [Fusarium sp. FIESC RH6]|nr:hypothetical protein LB507_009995 [Fusarium sp. FIESC RH6]
MRPVRGDEAEDLAKWKPMMILDKTLYGPAYIESLIAQNPGFVTSKTSGRKTFPLEIWHMILDFITNDAGSHDFALLRASHIEVGDATAQTLACNKINRWNSLGTLKNEDEVEKANKYLARPDWVFHDLPNPFYLHDDVSHHWEIPTRIFCSEIKSLHVEIDVPDFIKHLECGRCNLCSNKCNVLRRLPREIPGRQNFTQVRYFITTLLMCPVCVGLEATERCITEFSRLEPRDYLAWIGEELMRLLAMEEPFNEDLDKFMR